MFRLSLIVIVIVLGISGLSLQSHRVHAFGRGSTEPQLKSAPRKRALLVGAWDYPPGGEFPSLKVEGKTPGPVEDVNAIYKVLIAKGFPPGDIKVLTTRQQTTRKGILDAFK